MNINDFLSVDQILAEVTSINNDESMRKGFNRGWYISRIADALEELAIDTFFQSLTLDLPLPTETLATPMPKNGFNIKNLYLFNCGCSAINDPDCVDNSVDKSTCDCCNTNSSVNVYFKRGFNNQGRGTQYTAKRRQDRGASNTTNDPFHTGLDHGTRSGSLYYANVQNGMIMFSPDSRSFNKFRIEFSGLGVDVNNAEVPAIPRFFKRYVVHFVTERFYAAMQARNPRTFRTLRADELALLQKAERKARIRISGMDQWEQESMNEYIGSMFSK